MTITIAFFNHKGGVGKTTMLFNAAVEMGRLGKRVLMVDLDAQANLTAIALEDDVLNQLYPPAPAIGAGPEPSRVPLRHWLAAQVT